MALGGNVLRQHVVEFIRGTGVVTDGVVDATSLNGPWNWQVPEGVAELTMDAAAGGQSGMGGAPVTGGITSAGGGAAGVNGACLSGAKLAVRPGSLMTITLGAGGAATAAGQRGIDGGDTIVAGALAANFARSQVAQIRLAGGNAWQNNQPTAVSSGQGLGSNGVTGNAPAVGTNALGAVSAFTGVFMVGRDSGAPTAHGGAGNATGSVAGFSGGSLQSFNELFGRLHPLELAAAGATNGTTSIGGGGQGAPSLFGRGGNGGSNAAGENSPSYGAGGGGGAGGFGGGAGGDGYLRFTYWSMD